MKESKAFLDNSREEPLEEELMVFPEELNQELFEGDQLREEVRDKLIEIGNTFYETFDLKFDIIDMYFEGSMAQYNWVDLKNINGVEGLDYKSDIDLHLVVDYKKVGLPEEIISDYFIAKKQVFNEYHNITVKGFEVELGCEDSNTPLASQGVYSLYKDEWIKKPSPVSEEVENIRATPDYDEFRTYLINTVKSGDYNKAKDLWDKVKYMRKKSLSLDGEFGKGNLIFKALRQERLLDLLWTFVHNEEDKQLSLMESYDIEKRIEEIVNPDGYTEDQYNELMDHDPEDDEYWQQIDAELKDCEDEALSIRARREQIEEIKHGEQRLDTQIENNEPCIHVEFNHGDDDIGHCAEITADFFDSELPWVINIIGYSYGAFDISVSYQDITQIFGIKEEIIKEYLTILNKYGQIDKGIRNSIDFSKNIRKKEEVIEESIIETSELNALLREAENLIEVNSWYSDISIDSEEFKKLKEFLINKFNDKIVEFAIKYIGSWWNLETYLDKKVTLYKFGKTCMIISEMAKHTNEELLTSSNFIRIELINSQNWRVGTVLREAYEDTFNVYEDISNDETMTFYDVTARELVEVFNVKNRELLGNLIGRSVSRDHRMRSEDEEENVIEESLKDSSDSIIQRCLKRLNLKYDTDIMTDDMYPELEDELKDVVEPHILKYTSKLISNTFRPSVAIYINMALRLQDIANHTEEEFRPTSGVLVLDDDTSDCSHVVKFPAHRNVFEIERVGEPWNTLEFKNAKDLVELFHIKPENLEQLIKYHDQTYREAVKKGLFSGQDIKMDTARYTNIEESVDKKYEKYNKTGLSCEEIESFKSELAKEYDIKLVNYAFYYSSTYIGDDNLIDADIILQTLNIFKEIANHTREVVSDYQEIWLFNNDGTTEYMVGKVSSTFYNSKLNYNLWYGNHAYFDIKANDLINIFNVKPESISELTTQTMKTGDIANRPKGIIEEAYNPEDEAFTEKMVGTFLKIYGLYDGNFDKIKTFLPKYNMKEYLNNETYESLLQDLSKFYDNKLVEFAGEYIKSHIVDGDISKISLTLVFKYVIEMDLIAKHTDEDIFEEEEILLKLPTNSDVFGRATLICVMIGDRIRFSLRIGNDMFYNIAPKDLVEVFNINEEKVKEITKNTVKSEFKVIKSDVIEESINPQDSRVYAIMNHIFKEFPTLISKYGKFPVCDNSQPIIDYLKTQFDEKYVDYQINWYKKTFGSADCYATADIHSIIMHLFEMKEIAEHRDETKSILNEPCIQLGITDSRFVSVYYDDESRTFNLEIDPGAFWYDITAKDLVNVFNVSKDNISWLIKTTFDEHKNSWVRQAIKNRDVIEESYFEGSQEINDFVGRFCSSERIINGSLSFMSNKPIKYRRLQKVLKALKSHYFDEKLVDYCAENFKEYAIDVPLYSFLKSCYVFNKLVTSDEAKLVSHAATLDTAYDEIQLYKNGEYTGKVQVSPSNNIRLVVHSPTLDNYSFDNPEEFLSFFNINKELVAQLIQNEVKIRTDYYNRHMGANFKNNIEESLNEEFVTMKQRNTSYGKVVNSIVKNPTLKELKELAKEEEDNTFRVVVSEEQNPDFYFGTANEWIHHEITDTINLDSLTFYCYDLSTNTFYFNMSVQNREEALEYYFDFYYYFKGNSYLTSTFGDFNLVLFDKDIVGDTPFDSNIGDEGMYVFSKEELDAFENSERNNLDECCSATSSGDIAATVLPFGGIGSRYKAKKGDWKKSAEQINKEIVDNMV